ncbi:MAG: hypothetical protein ACI35R_11045 [Bacillus sp. (in: firmicutes)]
MGEFTHRKKGRAILIADDCKKEGITNRFVISRGQQGNILSFRGAEEHTTCKNTISIIPGYCMIRKRSKDMDTEALIAVALTAETLNGVADKGMFMGFAAVSEGTRGSSGPNHYRQIHWFRSKI